MFPWLVFLKVGDDDDLPDNFITVERYIGTDSSTSVGEFGLGVNDEDSVVYLYAGAVITEGGKLSVHKDDDTDYQNTSGFDAMAIVIIQALDTGAATRHVKLWSAPTTNSTTSATLLVEYGGTDSTHFDASNDLLTMPPVKIQNNHYLVVENVDDSRAGTNNVGVIGIQSGKIGFVVERGA